MKGLIGPGCKFRTMKDWAEWIHSNSRTQHDELSEEFRKYRFKNQQTMTEMNKNTKELITKTRKEILDQTSAIFDDIEQNQLKPIRD